MTTPRSMLPVLFVLLGACGDDAAPRAHEAEDVVVTLGVPVPATEEIDGGASSTARGANGGVAAVANVEPETEPATPPADPGTFGIVKATFTHAVDARRPVDEARSFTVGERATLHLVVKNLGAPRDVTIEWLRAETVLGRTTLQVGTSPAWRTWAFRRVGLNDVGGGVQVRVVDADDNVLYTGQAPVTTNTPPAV